MKKILTLLLCFYSIVLFAQWKYANFPFGGHIFTSTTKGNVTLAQAYPGLYRTTDNGSTWQLIDTIMSIRRFLVHGNEIFAIGNGVYRSVDDGLNWKKLPLSQTNLHSIAISKDTMYVGGSAVIYKSTDKGNTWKTITMGTLPYNIQDIVFMGNTIFAANTTGILVSTNHGRDWNLLNTPASNRNSHFLLKGDSLYTISLGKLYVTTDTGKTWTNLNATVNLQTIIQVGSKLYGLSSNGVYKSIDNGVNWVAVNKGIETYRVSSLSANGNHLFAGTGYGMYLSVNDGNWTAINNQITGMAIWQLAHSGTTIFASTTMGIFASHDHGQTWQWVYKQLGSDQAETAGIAVQGSTICAATNEHVLVSTDNGATWKSYLINNLNAQLEVVSFMDSTMIAGTWDYGMFQSADKGVTWTKMDTGTVASPAKLISSICVTNNAIFVGTYEYGLYRSTDKGKSWTALTKGLDPEKRISSITHLGSTIVVGAFKSMFLSTDNGDNWIPIHNGATFSWPTVTIIDNHLFVGDNQAYVTPLNNINWKHIPFNPRNGITSIIRDANNLFFATYGSGIWYKPIKDVIGDVPIDMQDQYGFKLYPNPNGGRFTLLQNGASLVEIYNLLGERVYVSEIQNLSTEIDLSSQSKGVYFVRRIQKDMPHVTQKIIFQ